MNPRVLIILTATLCIAAEATFGRAGGPELKGIELGEFPVRDADLWVADGKLHAKFGERKLLPVLERLEALTGIRFHAYGSDADQVVFGSFPEGLAVEEGVLRLLRWTSHAVVRDAQGRIAWIAVLPPANTDSVRQDDVSMIAAVDAPAPVVLEGPTQDNPLIAVDVFEDRLEAPPSVFREPVTGLLASGMETVDPPVAGCEDEGCELSYVSREDPEGWRWAPRWREPRIPVGAAN